MKRQTNLWLAWLPLVSCCKYYTFIFRSTYDAHNHKRHIVNSVKCIIQEKEFFLLLILSSLFLPIHFQIFQRHVCRIHYECVKAQYQWRMCCEYLLNIFPLCILLYMWKARKNKIVLYTHLEFLMEMYIWTHKSLDAFRVLQLWVYSTSHRGIHKTRSSVCIFRGCQFYHYFCDNFEFDLFTLALMLVLC